MAKMYDTLTGALCFFSLKERPLSFEKYLHAGTKSVITYPSKDCDFKAEILSCFGECLIAPTECFLLLSRYFAERGLPERALTVRCCGEESEIPTCRANPGENAYYFIKCKQLFPKSILLSGGIPHVLYTEGGKNRCRIVKAPNETDFSAELLRRLTVVDGLPDTVRCIAFRQVDGIYRMASTDRVITLDSVFPLVSLLVSQGVYGRVEIVCRGTTFEFTVDPGTKDWACISDSHFFTPNS